jgi:1,4-alpha-glucan branching enzyme
MSKGKFKFHAKASRQPKPKLTIPPEPKEIVHLEFCAPGAKEVSLAGSFNAWDAGALPMKKIGDATWAVDLELTPGRHEYRLVVDGQWQEDPNANDQTDNPYGGKNSVLLID